jgi:hypothetical protein
MKYRVETAVLDNDTSSISGISMVMISDWVEADDLCHAAIVFMMQQPVDREYLDTITVVERDTYHVGTYNHDTIRVACDYEVGLRTI